MAQLLVKLLTVHLAVAFLFVLMTWLSGSARGETIIGGLAVLKLPEPDRHGTVPLETTLQNRRSVRRFTDASLPLEAVSQLLWAAQGITDSRGLRTAPSAGALYPLEIYLVAGNVEGLENGIYRYKTAQHSLEFNLEGDYLNMLSRAALWQSAIQHAPAVLVIAGKQERTTDKYGKRGVRYMYMESGHAAQNICLQAVALDLDTVTIGAFTDHEVARILHIGKDIEPLYIIPVGWAKQ